MPTIVVILTFNLMSRINKTPESFKATEIFIFQVLFGFYEQLISCSADLTFKKFYTCNIEVSCQ